LATWDELLKDGKHIVRFPQTEVFKFVRGLEVAFQERPLAIWDQCCVGGRHSILVSQMGHHAYASDVSPTGISQLRGWAADAGVDCRTAVADMTEYPWTSGQTFHGIVCWDALHHNTVVNIQRAMEVLKQGLKIGGRLLLSLLSTKSEGHGEGREVERNTFVADDGLEAGVPHRYFDRSEVQSLIAG
jgi:2-polyprenyl-3-methyl-5-hydroxy-6-metoxy-1,4-benzoquinol methylase